MQTEHRDNEPTTDTTTDAEQPKRGPVERTYSEDEAPIERGTRAPGELRQTPRRS